MPEQASAGGLCIWRDAVEELVEPGLVAAQDPAEAAALLREM